MNKSGQNKMFKSDSSYWGILQPELFFLLQRELSPGIWTYKHLFKHLQPSGQTSSDPLLRFNCRAAWSSRDSVVIVQSSSLNLPCQEQKRAHRSLLPLLACMPWIMQFVSSMERIQNNSHSNRQTAHMSGNPLNAMARPKSLGITQIPVTHEFTL